MRGRRALVRRVLTALVVVQSSILAAATTTADARFLGLGSDSGSSPWAFVFSDDLPRPRAMQVYVSLSPNAALYSGSDYEVSCSAGSINSSVEHRITAGGTYNAPLTVYPADRCSISADVSYQSFNQSGSIQVSVYGQSWPKKKRKKKRH